MLMPFEALMNATWKAEGKWKDGTPFKQEVTYSWSDDEETREYGNQQLPRYDLY